MHLFKKKHDEDHSIQERRVNMSDVVELRPDKGQGKGLIAKKDFIINHNDYYKEIKAGNELADIPNQYLPNLRAEGVI